MTIIDQLKAKKGHIFLITITVTILLSMSSCIKPIYYNIMLVDWKNYVNTLKKLMLGNNAFDHCRLVKQVK